MDPTTTPVEPATAYPEAVIHEILQAIEDAGSSIQGAAHGIGMTRNTFVRRVAGHSFTIPEVARIAQFLGIEVETLTAPRRAA